MKRKTNAENYISLTEPSESQRALCVLVHGIGGNFTDAYWGNCQDLMKWEQQLSDCDIIFWGYASSKNPFNNFFSFFSKKRSVSTIEEASRDLAVDIRRILNEKCYKMVLLAGHSLGGLVVLGAIQELLPHPAIVEANLLATPRAPHPLARVAAFLSRANPQMSALAGQKQMFRLFSNAIATARSHGARITYTHYSRDELLDYSDEDFCDEHLSCQASHSWMSEPATRTTPAYATLLNWIRRRIQASVTK